MTLVRVIKRRLDNQYLTVAQLYEWAKERGLENKCILTYDSYGELCHYVDSDEIEVKDEDLVI